jgi:hypothetical protein
MRGLWCRDSTELDGVASKIGMRGLSCRDSAGLEAMASGVAIYVVGDRGGRSIVLFMVRKKPIKHEAVATGPKRGAQRRLQSTGSLPSLRTPPGRIAK